MSLERRRQGERIQQGIESIDSSVIDHYKPKYIGMGGEQVVFEVPKNPSVVVKVHKRLIEEYLQFVNLQGIELGEITDDAEDKLEDVLENFRELRKGVEEYFPGHTLKQKEYIGKVPINQEIINEIIDDSHKDISSKKVGDVYTVLRIQERLPEYALDEDAKSFCGKYVEMGMKDIDRETYERHFHEFIADQESDVFDQELFLSMVPRDTKDILLQSRDQEELENVLKDFVIRAIRMANETGHIIDLAGERNVIFYMNEEGNWAYIMPDAVYPSMSRLSLIKLAQEWVKNRWNANGSSLNALMNTLLFTRTLNGAARFLGLPDRVNAFDDEYPDPNQLYNDFSGVRDSGPDAETRKEPINS